MLWYEKLAAVKLTRYDDKYGFIDKSGDIVIDPQFDYESEFIEGLARVRKDGKYGYIDKTGKTIIPFKYEYVTDFKDGMALADGVIIDKQGNIVAKPPSGYYILEYNGINDGLIPVVCK